MEERGEGDSGSQRVTSPKSRRGPAAPEKSLRIKVFYRLLPQVSALARRRRMEAFIRILGIKPGLRVLDLGGAPSIWQNVPVPLDITILNLPGGVQPDERIAAETSIHTFHYLEGDACNAHQFPDRSFDLAFSNSVIEHVGPEEKQEAFAREVLRLGRAYWVQTPSVWFPIEAHTGLPLYWFYPQRFRAWLLWRSQRRLPAWWTDYIAETRVLSRRRMVELFPNARVHVELFFGLPKSYAVYLPPKSLALDDRQGVVGQSPASGAL